MADGTGLTLVVERNGDNVVVQVGGVLDLATTGMVETRVQAELIPATSVVLDLGGLRLIDSTGLGALVRLHRRAGTVGADFTLRNPRHHVADVLAMTGVARIIPVVSADS